MFTIYTETELAKALKILLLFFPPFLPPISSSSNLNSILGSNFAREYEIIVYFESFVTNFSIIVISFSNFSLVILKKKNEIKLM